MRPVSFPTAAGATMAQIRAGHPEAAVLAPSVSLLDVGSDRFGFAVFDAAHKLVNPSQVVLYESDPDGRNVRGPFPARLESLAVRPPFQSQTVARDPDAAKAVFVAQLPFPHRGKELITALANVGNKIVETTEDELVIGASGPQPPGVGQHAIAVHTPTVASAGGSAAIDTRTPPAPDLQHVDLASVLGRKPVVLQFATPALCQSRVCGPVVDIAEQVKSQTGDRVAFIHMEIYNKNNASAGLRPQLIAYHLQTEPWTFVIDRHGVVRDRIEGAFSAAELQQAVNRVAAG